MTDLDKIINEVLIKNNGHWLSREQAEHSISEGRLPITRKDVHDIVHTVLHGGTAQDNELDNLMNILKRAIDKNKNQ